MAHKITMAIIGAATSTGTAIAKSMAASYYLILMDKAADKLTALQSEIKSADYDFVIDTLQCCKEASWEADVIVVAVDSDQLVPVAHKIKEVTTCKPVIHFTNSDDETAALQPLLPHANVVSVWLGKPTGESNNRDATLHGTNREAQEIARKILSKLGCVQVINKC